MIKLSPSKVPPEVYERMCSKEDLSRIFSVLISEGCKANIPQEVALLQHKLTSNKKVLDLIATGSGGGVSGTTSSSSTGTTFPTSGTTEEDGTCLWDRCPLCPYQTTLSTDMDRHLARHLQKQKDLCCSFCGYRTSRSDHMRSHVARHTGEGCVQCPACSYKTGRKDHMKRHMASCKNCQQLGITNAPTKPEVS
ncbi:hypothetical protein HAZT_HAZT010728 [Hyalella azteca]|uniref:C2H2-type domain-containing protein n=1 Tax=Hyalella azteca TaxID=294128 RepID=A0A6A0GUS3_HYAAZ|nr:hypothetical protein HAZT_HAZT010728 [Hyalella azteca]